MHRQAILAAVFWGGSLAAASPTKLIVSRGSIKDKSKLHTDVNLYCGHDKGFASEAEFDEFWQDSYAGVLMDQIGKGFGDVDGPVDWLYNLQEWVYPAGNYDPITKCRSLESECKLGDPSMNCEDYFWGFADSDVFGHSTYGRAVWWIFRSVERFHEVLKALKAEVFKEVVVQGLKIDQMVEDLGEMPEVFNAAEAISTAFGIASTLVGELNPVAGAVTSLVSDLLALVPPPREPEAIEGGLGEFLADAFEANLDGLSAALNIITGGAESEQDYYNLPQLGPGSSGLGGFMSSYIPYMPFDDNTAVEALHFTGLSLETRMADYILQAAGWQLWHYPSEDPESCGFEAGHQFIEYRGWKLCTFLARAERTNSGVDEPDEAFYVKMGEYGLGNRHEYYVSLLDCVYGSDRVEERGGVEYVGNLPQCYYRVPVRLQGPCFETPGNHQTGSGDCPEYEAPDGVKLDSGLDHCADFGNEQDCGPMTNTD